MKKAGTSNHPSDIRKLVRAGRLDLSEEALDTLPQPRHHGGVAFDRVEGMLLGLAIGDALGNTSESRIPSERRDIYGEILDYLPNRHASERRVGLPSDDTQLAFWTLEHLLENGRIAPEQLADIFRSRGVFGI